LRLTIYESDEFARTRIFLWRVIRKS